MNTPFRLKAKVIKYVGINLVRNVKKYGRKFKAFLQDPKVDVSKWKTCLVPGRVIKIIKMSFLPELFYKLAESQVKTPSFSFESRHNGTKVCVETKHGRAGSTEKKGCKERRARTTFTIQRASNKLIRHNPGTGVNRKRTVRAKTEKRTA